MAQRYLIMLTVLAATAYLAVAGWSRYPEAATDHPSGREVVLLTGPYERDGNAYIFRGLGDLDKLADNPNLPDDRGSPVVVFEEARRLSPAHSTYRDVRDLGGGRFAHQQNRGLIFSASDNSDPATNHRRYWAVRP